MHVDESSQRLKYLLTCPDTFSEGTEAYPMWTKTNLFSRLKHPSSHSFEITLNTGVFYL